MWLLPSYNRPEQCRAVIDQINKIGCETFGLLWVNGPEQLEKYKKIELPSLWRVHYHEENIGVCGAMNAAFGMYPEQPYYGLICDDEYVYTPAWDKTLSQAAGNWHIAHGNEGWQSSRRIHSYVTVGGELVRECGWWSLPGLWHWYHDNVQEVLAAHAELRIFCQDVRTEHKHYLAGKAEKDTTYSSGESRATQDEAVFKNWINNPNTPQLINRIRAKKNENSAYGRVISG